MKTQTDNTAPAADDTTDNVADWDAAFDDFYEENGADLDDDKDDTNETDDGADDTSGTGDDDTGADDKGDDTGNDDVTTPTKKSGEEDVVGNTDDTDDDKSKIAVKEALKEVYEEQQQTQSRTQELSEEAVKLIFPNGIEDPRVDSDGDKIDGPEDVERLYNPQTGELFTPDEARRWYDQATKQYEQNVQAAQQEAARVAQVSLNLEKGREAVLRNYGDFINENPEIAQKVLDRYMSTVKLGGEGDNIYIADTPVDILEFYNDVMYPYVELAEKRKEAEEAAAAAEQAKKDAIARAKAERDESRDFKTSVGEDATKTGEEGSWDDAFKSYYGK